MMSHKESGLTESHCRIFSDVSMYYIIRSYCSWTKICACGSFCGSDGTTRIIPSPKGLSRRQSTCLCYESLYTCRRETLTRDSRTLRLGRSGGSVLCLQLLMFLLLLPPILAFISLPHPVNRIFQYDRSILHLQARNRWQSRVEWCRICLFCMNRTCKMPYRRSC